MDISLNIIGRRFPMKRADRKMIVFFVVNN